MEKKIKNKQKQPPSLQNKKTYKFEESKSAKEISLSLGNWSPLNFTLVKNIGFKEASVMAFLLHQEGFWFDNHKLQPDGSFYLTQEDAKNWLDLTHTTQVKIFSKLQDLNLIEVSYKYLPEGGFKKTRFIKIKKEKLIELSSTILNPA